MKSLLKIQMNGVNTLRDEMLKNSNKDLKKFYCFCSNLKETGYDVIEEILIDLKAKKQLVFGIDKKNTTKKMLESVLKYTKSVSVYDNNQDVELSANIFAFEYENKAFVYLLNGDLTDSLLTTDIAIYTVLEFNMVEDKDEYAAYIDSLTKGLKDICEKLTKELILELLDTKKIFSSKQFIHVVPTISDLMGGEIKDTSKSETSKKLPKVELNNLEDVSFEIDLSDAKKNEESIETDETDDVNNIDVTNLEEKPVDISDMGLEEGSVNEDEVEDTFIPSDEVIDMESMVFDSAPIKLDKKKVIKKAKLEDEEKTKVSSKKIDLSKVSNIIMELPTKPSKGRDADAIKVPVYIKDMIPVFFESMEDSKLVNRDNGQYKETNIELEIIDVNSGNRYKDMNAKLSQRVGQTYLTFESSKLEELTYEEKDIARVIKLSSNSYHIEIIPHEIEEYGLWKKMCTNNFRGTNRQYGLM